MKIVYLDIDSLRPDHLGCYGYHRNTSPNIDKIAEESLRMNNVYCSDAPCLPSRTAMYTGRFGIHTGVVSHGGTAADPRLDGPSRGTRDVIESTSLPRFLQLQGLHTAQISPFGQRHAARQFFSGFNEIHSTGDGGSESAEVVTPVVEKWIKANAASKDDWYLHINYWDPHTPYRTPADYPNHFAEDPLPDWITDEVFENIFRKSVLTEHGEIGMFSWERPKPFPKHPGELLNRDDLREMIDGYDTGVRYVDDQVGKILQWLKDEGVYDETIIIISADHGENMGELGIYGEHATADQPTTHIPMIIRWPGKVAPGSTDDGLHYNLDMAPTLAEMLGEDPMPNWDGQSYAPTITEGKDTGRESLVIGQCVHVCQRSVRFEDWLYIRTYDDGYHLFPKEMLYNLKDDPFEQNDLAGERQDICNQALRKLTDWHDDMMKTNTSDTDPLWTVMQEHSLIYNRGQLKNYCKRLEDTGRGWAVPELKKRHPHEFE